MTTAHRVLFLTPPVSPAQSYCAVPSSFFNHVQAAGIHIQHALVHPGANESEGADSFQQILQKTGDFRPDIIHVNMPLSDQAMIALRGKWQDAKVVVSVDRPAQIALYSAALVRSDAVVWPHDSFVDVISDRNTRGRLVLARDEGRIFAIPPGIDLDEFNPAHDKYRSDYYRYAHERRGGADKPTGPNGKARSYQGLMIHAGVHMSRDVENIAYPFVPDDPDVIAAARPFLEVIAAHHLGRADTYFMGTERPDGFINEYAALAGRDDRVGFVNISDPASLRLMLSGSAIAVFFPEPSSPDFASNAMIRSILTFMRYGTMPVVPNSLRGRGVVEECILPETEKPPVWLHPEGFGFFYDRHSPGTVISAMGTAAMHEFRTKIGHAIYSGAVPNAMKAAENFGVEKEALAYVEMYRSLLQ